ncbi:amino acid adenylation domain-containing protein [Streptomyces sp. ODS28]|uniref:amino acid adenylation domain-containing protein n=1 Tax=Streptomyces sp. ODS28 TaxID=3136688 RepID=UPI0031ECA9C2
MTAPCPLTPTASAGRSPVRTGAHACLPDLLLDRVKSRPDAVAVAGHTGSLTYRDLLRSAFGTAARLTALGIGPDDTVGLYAEPSADLITGVWGILFAGGAYLPLSPEYPDERLRYMIEDSRTRVVLAPGHLAGDLAALAPPGTRIVPLGDAAPTEEVPQAAWRPDALAYVIYTSGSTGKPKGVMVEHRAVVSQLRWLHTHGHLDQHSVILQKTPMSFDAAQWEILAPALGARVVTAPPGSHRDPQALINAVLAHEVTTLQCVPTLLQALIDTAELGLCTSLTRVFSGGEALTRHLARSFFAELPGTALINLYGPTETTINATAHAVDPAAVPEGSGTLPIGTPVDNTTCFILDEHLAPVDIGETGELFIGGAQLARGYLHRPEQTRERFIPSPFNPTQRLYRTGDLACWNADGTIRFAGRTDNQVKLRGHRIELDEVATAIEQHAWVRKAAAVVVDDARTGHRQLVACVELDPREASLMDQGHDAGHHRSKAGRHQVKAQLSDAGVRTGAELSGRAEVRLPGAEGTAHQRATAFARKTYRFYEGGPVREQDLLSLLAPPATPAYATRERALDLHELGEILRWFGPFHGAERLLPKYAYASPGALYATQLHVETGGIPGLEAGVYYYHPLDHSLVRVGDSTPAAAAEGMLLHFSGRRSAIEPVYRTNVDEVLEFEAGHMLGVLREVLPQHGLGVRPLHRDPAIAERHLDLREDDHFIGSFALGVHSGTSRPDPVELYLQIHPGRVEGLAAGTYRCLSDGRLERISDALVQRRHVVAINQRVYDRAAFGISAVSRGAEPWLHYVALGAALHRLQRNDLGIGLMSSGYSSRSGHPLPAARRLDTLLADAGEAPAGASYFFVGGRVSREQIRSEGMYEDTVHMKGPTELIREDLEQQLPDYMLPSRVLLLHALPLTANGKIDTRTLAASPEVSTAVSDAPYVAPATATERRLATAWGKALKYERVSALDEFFACGGNSLSAVALINGINRDYGTRLPFQVLFECPRLADLAARIDAEAEAGEEAPAGRLVTLHQGEPDQPVFCWPGLGGYPMNLRRLARETAQGRSFYGVQAHGLNAGESPYATIRETAAADIAEIRRVRPHGPYTLWGYSFGARVAFETAFQLEQAGEKVAQLLLICPGNPRVHGTGAGAGTGEAPSRTASFADPSYLTILLSVFTGTTSGPELERCLSGRHDEESFTAFVHELVPDLDPALIRRIVRLVGATYEFEYTFRELAERRIQAPVTVLKASGDDYSFIDAHSGYAAEPPMVAELAGDHFGVLREPGVAELAEAVRAALLR